MTTRKDFGAAIQNAQLDVGPFMSPTPYTIQVRATDSPHDIRLQCRLVWNDRSIAT